MYLKKQLLPCCRNCYWFDGKYCEIYHECIDTRSCVQYLNDDFHSRRVNEWIEKNPEMAIKRWHLIDDISRNKFIERWGEVVDWF